MPVGEQDDTVGQSLLLEPIGKGRNRWFTQYGPAHTQLPNSA